MRHFSSQVAPREEGIGAISSPSPLGLITIALTTALLGASFARFLVPTVFLGIGTIAAPVLVYGGVVQVLAGMWAFRRNQSLAATLFSAYGGFLIALGAFFLPLFGFTRLFGTDVLVFNHALGLLFLCWTISLAVLLVGALKTHLALIVLLAFLFLAFLFLTIGEFANGNGTLLAIGGWLGIVSALIAWYTAMGELLQATQSPFQLPLGEQGKVPLASGQRYGGEPAI